MNEEFQGLLRQAVSDHAQQVEKALLLLICKGYSTRQLSLREHYRWEGLVWKMDTTICSAGAPLNTIST